MRQAIIQYKGDAAGILCQYDDGSFRFRYDDAWFQHPQKPAVSLTLPKSQQQYDSQHLFACFHNMLPEGDNREVLCRRFRIDLDDDFGLLLLVSENDSIGALRLKRIPS